MNTGRNRRRSNSSTALAYFYAKAVQQAQHGRIAETGFTEVVCRGIDGIIERRTEVGSSQIGPFENGLVQVALQEAGLGKVWFAKVGFANGALVEHRFLEVFTNKEVWK